jgi:hypothetical protein
MAPDLWSETALVAISAQGGTNVPFACLTETIDIDIGDKDFEVINSLCGGRMVKFNPQDVTTVTLEAYPLEAGTMNLTATTTSGTGFFDLMNTVDTTQPLTIPADRTRTPYRLAIMWTDKTAETDATAAIIAPTNTALRFVGADGYFTSVKPSFTDGQLKFTVNYKVPAFDKTGSANIKMESVAGETTATMTALASYTSTVKW